MWQLKLIKKNSVILLKLIPILLRITVDNKFNLPFSPSTMNWVTFIFDIA